MQLGKCSDWRTGPPLVCFLSLADWQTHRQTTKESHRVLVEVLPREAPEGPAPLPEGPTSESCFFG